MGSGIYLVVVLICISPVSNNIELLFWPFVYLLWRMSVPIFSHFLIGFFSLFIIVMRVLCIFWVSVLYQILDLQIFFSHSLSYLSLFS